MTERQYFYDTLLDVDWEQAELAAQTCEKQWQIAPVSEDWVTQENCSPRELAQLAGLRPGRKGDKSTPGGGRPQ